MKKLLLYALFISSFIGHTQTLDTTFNGTGVVTTLCPNFLENYQIYDAEMQSDGKVIYLGSLPKDDISYSNFYLARYNLDGTLDNTFNYSGFRIFNNSTTGKYCLKIQNDGKIIVAGSFTNNNVYRFNTDGSIDNSFGTNGHITIGNSITTSMTIRTIQVQTDNKIVLTGNGKLIRLNYDGSLDPSFGNGGIINLLNSNNDVAIQSDGKIISIGIANTVISTERFNSDGSHDSTFGTNGINLFSFTMSTAGGATIAVQADGKIVELISKSSHLLMLRYNSDGTLDTSFDGDGILDSTIPFYFNTPTRPRIKTLLDGKIIVSGTTYSTLNSYKCLGVFKFNIDGSLDSTFATNGQFQYLTDSMYSFILIVKNDGEINTCGISTNGFNEKIILSSDGIFQNASTLNLFQIYPEFNNTIEQNDGKIVVLLNKKILFRFNTDGSIDSSFGTNGILDLNTISTNIVVSNLAKQPDGKIILYPRDFSTEMYRINVDGTPDITFGVNGMLDTISLLNNPTLVIENIAFSNDNKMLVSCFNYNYSSCALLKLNFDGTIDSTFGTDGVLMPSRFNLFASNENEGLDDLIIQSDNKIVALCGLFYYSSNNIDQSIAIGITRLNPDGTIDTSFGINGKLVIENNGYNYPQKIVLLENDNFLIKSDIGHDESILYKFNSNGTYDTSFANNGVLYNTDNGHTDVIVQPDFKILKSSNVNNQFTTARYDNVTGALDTTFGTNGFINTPIGLGSNINQLTWLQNNTLLASGTSFDGTNEVIALARYVNLNLGTLTFTNQNAQSLVYPNPIQEESTFEYTVQNDEIISIEIIDMQGRIVQTIVKNKELSQGSYKQNINLSNLTTSGNYILKFSSSKGSEAIKIIKK